MTRSATLVLLALLAGGLGARPEAGPPGSARERVAALLEQVNRTESANPQGALALAAEGLELARQVGDAEKEASFLASSSYCHSQLGDFTLAVRFGKESLDLSRRIGNKTRIASASNVLGIAYTFMGAYSQALESHLEALRFREELSLESASIKSLNNIGIVYHNIGQYEKAIVYYNKILDKLEKNPSIGNLIVVKLNLGSAETKLGRFELALKHLQEGLDLINARNERTLVAYAYLNLGIAHTDLKGYGEAGRFLDQALREYDLRNQKYGRIQTLNAKARMLHLSGANARAIPCAQEAAALAMRLNAGKELVTSYQLLSSIFEKQNNIEQAFKYHKSYIEQKEIIYSVQEKEKIFDMTEKMQAIRRDAELESLKREKLLSELRSARTRIYQLILGSSLVFLVIIVSILFIYNKKINKNKTMLEASNLELGRLNRELQDRMTEIKTLTGLLPICAQCKKIRNDQGYWEQLEGYISQHTAATFTHGICPGCAEAFYPEATRRDPAAGVTSA